MTNMLRKASCHARTYPVESLCNATCFQYFINGLRQYRPLSYIFVSLHHLVQTTATGQWKTYFFLSLSFSLTQSVCPPPLLPPVWSELNQNRLLVNGSLVKLWLVSECKQPPCCCLFSTGLMLCSLDYSGSLCLSLSLYFLPSLSHFFFVPLFSVPPHLHVWHIFIVHLVHHHSSFSFLHSL